MSDHSVPAGIPVEIDSDNEKLPGMLEVPSGAQALVIFAHGSGSDRRSPRNAKVALALNEKGVATLVFDLLTAAEQEKYDETVFDMNLLTRRLAGAVAWARSQERLANLKLGLAGASTGAGAALNVAAGLGDAVTAIVSRGGRPDLADQGKVPAVKAPTLYIVGANDTDVIEMNASTSELMGVEHELKLVPGATHIFAEPGTLEVAAKLTVDWFERLLLQPPKETTQYCG